MTSNGRNIITEAGLTRLVQQVQPDKDTDKEEKRKRPCSAFWEISINLPCKHLQNHMNQALQISANLPTLR